MAKKTEAQQKGGLQISVRTFALTVGLLLGIMLLAGILTRVVPQGSYQRVIEDGRSVIVPGTYVVDGEAARLPIWRWLTSPVEVLFTDKAVSAIMIMLLITLIGGSFLVLETSGVLAAFMFGIIQRYGKQKYKLMALMVLVCMLLGSCLGMFEETVTLVPITVALALMLGWDSLVGIGISVLSVGFGFAAGTLNPFTVAITQQLADLPTFSGLWLRVIWFFVIYGLLLLFLYRYAKKIEANPAASIMHETDMAARARYEAELARVDAADKSKKAALKILGAALAVVFIYVLAGVFVPALTDYSMPLMALMFTLGSTLAARKAGLKGVGKTFLKGMVSLSPSVLLILLAMSTTHILETGGIIDTILHSFYNLVQGLGPYGAVLALFALVLVLQFFIGSAAAKAFLLMPLLVPLADMIGLTRQTAVQAFILADGFTNMLFPTNVVLLITLGIVSVPYGKWFRWTWKLQAALVALSLLLLLLCVKIGYGPY